MDPLDVPVYLNMEKEISILLWYVTYDVRIVRFDEMQVPKYKELQKCIDILCFFMALQRLCKEALLFISS